MRMIRWICGYEMMHKIMNEVIRNIVKVHPIGDKMVWSCEENECGCFSEKI